MISRKILLLTLVSGCLNSPAPDSKVNTLTPNQPYFFSQCRGPAQIVKRFPGLDLQIRENKTSRFHRFGSAVPGQSTYVRQEVRQTETTSEKGIPCAMAPITRIATFSSPIYDEAIKKGSIVTPMENGVPDNYSCGKVTEMLNVGDLKEGTQVLIPLAPYFESSPPWNGAGYKNPYAIFTIQKIITTIGGISSPDMLSLEGVFEPIEITNYTDTKVIEPTQISKVLTGAPLYKGWVAIADSLDFMPQATFGWVRSALYLERMEQVNGKFLPAMKLVVGNWN